jgi:hypothetical protein
LKWLLFLPMRESLQGKSRKSWDTLGQRIIVAWLMAVAIESAGEGKVDAWDD